MTQLSRYFSIPSSEAALIVVDYGVFKQTGGTVVGKSLKHLLHCLDVLPVFFLLTVKEDSAS